jgi:hypothetical protein
MAIKAPIPWEYGYLFKVLPEAMVNRMTTDTSNTELVQTLLSMFGQVTPSVLPTAVKPFIEAGMNYDTFTSRPIISEEQGKRPVNEQYTPSTTAIGRMLGVELANVGGKSYGVSPIVLEHFAKSYLAPMGFMFAQVASMPFESESFTNATGTPYYPRAARKIGELPLLGGSFQDSDGARYMNLMEDLALKATQQKGTYDRMVKEQRFDDASNFFSDPDKMDQYMAASPSAKWQEQDQKIRQMQAQYRFMPGMDATEKRELIRQLEEQRIALAKTYRPLFPVQ